MADTVSLGSSQKSFDGASSGAAKIKKSQTDAGKELKREKALRKVLKEELKKKNDRVGELERELERQSGKVAELEKEIKEKETKFLDLYMENSNQHDKILELTYLLDSEVSFTIP
jgi:chromosome segregation ATPase